MDILIRNIQNNFSLEATQQCYFSGAQLPITQCTILIPRQPTSEDSLIHRFSQRSSDFQRQKNTRKLVKTLKSYSLVTRKNIQTSTAISSNSQRLHHFIAMSTLKTKKNFIGQLLLNSRLIKPLLSSLTHQIFFTRKSEPLITLFVLSQTRKTRPKNYLSLITTTPN